MAGHGRLAQPRSLLLCCDEGGTSNLSFFTLLLEQSCCVCNSDINDPFCLHIFDINFEIFSLYLKITIPISLYVSHGEHWKNTQNKIGPPSISKELQNSSLANKHMVT
jgi:hypothetical protein